MNLRELPNIITVLRMFLVLPVVVLLIDGRYLAALAVFAIAGVSDALDGYLAKRFGWQSYLGSILDPLADKLLLVSSYVTLAWLGHLPTWLVSAVIVRDVIIIVGSITYHLEVEQFSAAPSLSSKLNTFMQIALVLVIVVHHGLLPLPVRIVDTLIYLTLFTTLYSGFAYILTWGRRALVLQRRK